MVKLTKGERAFLKMAVQFGGTCRVFMDQRTMADRLEVHGLMTGNGKYFDRETTITDAGRAALDAAGK